MADIVWLAICDSPMTGTILVVYVGEWWRLRDVAWRYAVKNVVSLPREMVSAWVQAYAGQLFRSGIAGIYLDGAHCRAN